MQLEPFYRARFTTPESWSVDLTGPQGTESQSFLVAEGRCEGAIAARLRGANYPRRRTDGTLTPDFRGVLETDDDAVILFEWHGYVRTDAAGTRQLLGSMTHLSDDERYGWLNNVFCGVAGEVQPHAEGRGADVVLDVFQFVWEPLGEA